MGAKLILSSHFFTGVSNKASELDLRLYILYKKICVVVVVVVVDYFLINSNKMYRSVLDTLERLNYFWSLFFSFWIIPSTFLNFLVSHFFLKRLYNIFYMWCKYCTPPRVRRCNTKYSTLNLEYLIEINLHICILKLTSFRPFFSCCCCCCCCGCCFKLFFDFLFLERSFILFRGNFPLYFFNQKSWCFLFIQHIFFFYMAFLYFIFHFHLWHMFFLIIGFFSLFLLLLSGILFDKISQWDFLTWKRNRLPLNNYNLYKRVYQQPTP